MTPRELMIEYLAAARRGDWDAAFGHFADDILIRIPGRSEWAGERRGRAAVAGYIEAVRNRYRDGRIELELIDMPAGEGRGVRLVREPFLGSGAPGEIGRANVYTIRDNRIAEISI